MPMISMIMFWSHKEIDLLLNLYNYKKTLLKTERPSMKQQSKEPTIMLNSKVKLLNTMKPLVLLMNHLVYSVN